MAKDSFLFVPYHGGQQHDNASVKITNSDARSHAAAVSRQRREDRRLRSQPASVSTALSPTIHNLNTTDQPARHDEQHQTSGTEKPASNQSGGKAMAVTSRRQHMRAMQFSWRAGNANSPIHYSSGMRVDPFGVALDSDFGRAAVDYFWQIISKMNQPVYTIFNVSNTYGPFWGELMMDEDYQTAGLAVVGAIMNRAGSPARESVDMVNRYRNSAMVRLHKRYSRISNFMADDITIMLVTSLAQLAAVLGDLESHETHRQMVRKMVDRRGGLEALGHGGLMKCVLLQWDSFWSFTTSGQPLFSTPQPQPDLTYPAFPLDVEMRQTFNRIPPGFQILILQGRISHGTIELIGRVTDAQNSTLKDLSSTLAHTEIRRFTDFTQACPCLSTGDETKLALEKEICLAALLYCFDEFVTERSHVSLFAASRRELTRLLEKRSRREFSPPERECLVWICAVCINSWHVNPAVNLPPTQASQLLSSFTHLSENMDVDTCLRKFFYNDAFIAACDKIPAMVL